MKKVLPTFPDGGTRAWLVVLGVAALNFATFGMTVSWGAFQSYYEQTLLHDYSSSTISWIGSLQFALIFMPGVFTGRILDMGYHKLPLGLASAFYVLCTFLTAECKEYYQFLLCQGFGMGLACGFIFPPTLGIVSQWFHKRRATAFGITASGTSLGGIVFPILIRFLLPSLGFKWTVRVLAFIVAFALLLGFLATKTRIPPRPIKKWFNADVIADQGLLFYSAGSFFAFLGMYAILTFLAVSAVVKGIDRSSAFYFVSIMNGASIVGRLSAGVLGDIFGPLNLLIPFTFIAGIVSYAWPYAHNYGGFVGISIVYGMAFGAYVGLLPSPAASLGPIETVGERVGFQLSFMSIAILIGSPIAGAIRARPLGFRGTGIYAGSCIMLAVVCLVLTRRVAKKTWFRGKI